MNGHLYEVRLAKDIRVKFVPCRKLCLQIGDDAVEPPRQFKSVRSWLFGDGENHRWLPVERTLAAARRFAHPDRAEITHTHRQPIPDRHHSLRNVCERMDP